ncbi:hypothetical protein RPD_0039 [Rhodopseudomonas palustris BisB5]|uniref:Uncharacterized protein n=1 Tax=Rhodopseudomonas palustris (strain BisB5) TaxID=316057 RepID=Q13F60_RHOPS|nr:hypothetical protein RPD_0039 [Rhodopseudomonas palustris BisB5]
MSSKKRIKPQRKDRDAAAGVQGLVQGSKQRARGDLRWRHRHQIRKNGLLLNKIHHAAYDADLRVHISERLLSQQGDPLLAKAVAAMKGAKQRLPRRDKTNKIQIGWRKGSSKNKQRCDRYAER